LDPLRELRCLDALRFLVGEVITMYSALAPFAKKAVDRPLFAHRSYKRVGGLAHRLERRMVWLLKCSPGT
jgi:hypothetical protein